MNKMLFLALALLLTMSLLPAQAEEIPELPQEEEAPSPAGKWYALDHGLAVTLTLREDGTYSFLYPAFPGDGTDGAWVLDEGFVRLDEDEDAVFSFDGDQLTCRWLDLYFKREPTEAYAPADVLADATLEMFEGGWRTAYTLTDGAVLPQAWQEEDACAYVEWNRVAVAGSRFGEILVDCAFENGALSYTAQALSLRLEMQKDLLLRMTIIKDGEENTLLLIPYTPQALIPEEEAGE